MILRIPSHLLGRMALNVAIDGVLAATGVVLSFWLAAPGGQWSDEHALPLGGAVAIWLIGVPFGLSRLHWRFVSFRDLAMLAAAAAVTATMLVLLMVGAGLPMPSPAFPMILAIVLIVLLAGPKLIYRVARQPKADTAEQTAVLVGPGEAAEIFLAVHARANAAYRVTGLITLSKKHVGRRVHGLDVFGAVEDSAQALARLPERPDLLIITTQMLQGDALAKLLAAAEGEGIQVMRAPSVTSLKPAEQKLELQPISIEDLLNRKQVRLDREGMAGLIAGRRVMVTGAGGSIGSELARQVAGLRPAELLLLDHGEFALWQIDLELAELHPATKKRTMIGDVRDAARMSTICQDFRPELVFHAAALKHVPMVEANPLEGVRTNTLGTRAVADAAAASGARLMVLISTDKAVNPSSVMGATKRLAEMYAQALDVLARRRGVGQMRCVTVRFGNVLGSTGSVVPLFRRQLAQGGPLTVTHPEMQRYFMTVREAVGLVLQACLVGSGEAAIPDGGIFVLDMGEPVKILDLARQMIRLVGLRPEVDVQIQFTGLRPGEKLFEELFHGAERPEPTGYEGLLMASPRLSDMRAVKGALAELEAAAAADDAEGALHVLARMIPEFGVQDGLAVLGAAE